MKKYQLPKEFAKKWLYALRSGEYKQTNGTLCKDGKFCCLGVAAHISGVNIDLITSKAIIHNNFNLPVGITGAAGDNPLVAFLVTHNDGEVDENLNPKGEKWDFIKIADWIEKNVEFI